MTPASGKAMESLVAAAVGSQQASINCDSFEDLRKACTPSIYVVEKKKTQVAFEIGFLPTLRFCFAGSRSVVMASSKDIFSYLDKKLGTHDRKQFQNFLGLLTAKECTNFVEAGGKLYYADVHPGMSLYAPPGFQFWERVSADHDFVGGKSILFLQAKVDGEESSGVDSEALMSALHTELLKRDSVNPIIEQAMAVWVG